MPEGPEVALKAEELNAYISKYGDILINIEYKTCKKYNATLDEPIRIKRIFSRGKVIIWECEGNDNNEEVYIVIHLGMTGNFVYGKKDSDNHSDSDKHSHKHNHVKFTFLSNNERNEEIYEYVIYFSDIRKFGSVDKCDSKKLKDILKNHGPCLLTAAKMNYENYENNNKNENNENNQNHELSKYQEPATLEIFKNKLQMRNKRSRTKICIAEYLMEQKNTSGIGNYLRAEILYVCKMSPYKSISELNDKEIELLYNKTIETIYQSWLCKGPSAGYIFNGCFPLLVYGKKTDKYGNKILTYTDKNNRTVHYAENIQV